MKLFTFYVLLLGLFLTARIFPQQITVVAPNGGENLPAGAAYGIRWTDDISEWVRIDLYKNDSFYFTIVDSTESDAYYAWYVPDTTSGGSSYKIKITSVIDNNITDFSDNDFTIEENQINITAPNGGENWQTGYPHSITWTDNIDENVKIELFKGGSFYDTIATSTASDGYFSWVVPVGAVPGTDYQIKITSVDFASISDISDSAFSLYTLNLTLTSPNGGENIMAGTAFAITWTDNISEYVSIELYKTGAYYYTIADSTPSDAYYTWSVPDTLAGGSDYTVKIMSVLNNNIYDLSDSSFTITGNFITLTSPNGGDTARAGFSQAITWTDNINEQVKIELYKSGSYYYTITDSTPSDAYYSWSIPDTIPNGTDYKIKISSVDFSSISDTSDNNFTILGNYITITAPNGGEEWLTGIPHAITWADNIGEGVTIQLFKGGSFYFTIVDTTPSNAYFAWTVPDTITLGNDYSIKIMSVDYGSIYDMSDGNFTLTNTTGLESIDNKIPEVYSLSQNFPNPFNPTTYIMFGLPQNSNVTLTVYDITGQQVAVIINNEPLAAGMIRYSFDASKFASGIYIYRMTAASNVSNEKFVQTRKMILLK